MESIFKTEDDEESKTSFPPLPKYEQIFPSEIKSEFKVEDSEQCETYLPLDGNYYDIIFMLNQ